MATIEYPEELDPCPFCGGRLYERSFDRGIHYGCEPCGYSRAFGGLVTIIKTPVKIPSGAKRNIDDYNKPSDFNQEYYNQFAHEEAIAAMNRRVR